MAGDIIEEFTAKDGRKFILRVSTTNDLSTYLDFINELVREVLRLNKTRSKPMKKKVDI